MNGLEQPIKPDLRVYFRRRHGRQTETDPLQARRSDLHEQSSDCFLTPAPILKTSQGELFARQSLEREGCCNRGYHGLLRLNEGLYFRSEISRLKGWIADQQRFNFIEKAQQPLLFNQAV